MNKQARCTGALPDVNELIGRRRGEVPIGG
jgi:hypothetical protein